MSARGKRASNPMDKKIPENPKYKHVRSTLDTGASLSKYNEKIEELKRDYNFRKDEIFKRMKIPTFVQLVVQVSDVDAMESIAEEETAYKSSASERPDTADKEVYMIQKGEELSSESSRLSPVDTSRSRLEQVINGVGEVELDTPKPPPVPALQGDNCPYLLLDVRDQDAFDACHIITAKSYPTAMLARSVNYETKEMLKYRNAPGKIILVYDDDERISHRAATTLVERGYDNLFMLSGGLKVAYKLFPTGLITGSLPVALLEDLGDKKAKSKESMAARVNATDEYFQLSHVDKLLDHLDTALSDRSSGSRLSKMSSRTGRASSISSTTSVAGRKPFK